MKTHHVVQNCLVLPFSGRNLIAKLLAISLISSLGCASNRELVRPLSSQAINTVVRAAGKNPVNIQFTESTGAPVRPIRAVQMTPKEDYSVRTGKIVDLSGEDLLLRESAGQDLMISVRDMQSIEIVDRGKGIRDGFLLGALLGALVGSVTGSLLGSPCQNASPEVCNSTATGVPGFAVLGALIGGILGVSIGAKIGHRTIFTF